MQPMTHLQKGPFDRCGTYLVGVTAALPVHTISTFSAWITHETFAREGTSIRTTDWNLGQNLSDSRGRNIYKHMLHHFVNRFLVQTLPKKHVARQQDRAGHI